MFYILWRGNFDKWYPLTTVINNHLRLLSQYLFIDIYIYNIRMYVPSVTSHDPESILEHLTLLSCNISHSRRSFRSLPPIFLKHGNNRRWRYTLFSYVAIWNLVCNVQLYVLARPKIELCFVNLTISSHELYGIERQQVPWWVRPIAIDFLYFASKVRIYYRSNNLVIMQF